MIESELFDLMLRCNMAQLDVIKQKLSLNQAVLPGPSAAIATVASAILQLAKQQDLLSALEDILCEFFPRRREAKEDATEGKRILVLAANPIDTVRLRLDEEVRTIRERLNEGEAGRQYTVALEWAVRITDVAQFIEVCSS
jgi:hypothetical protein